MSFGIYPVFRPQLDVSGDLYFEGGDLLEALSDLDEIAAQGNVMQPSCFTDSRDVPEDFDGDPEELLEIIGPWEDWFEVDSGLETFDYLRATLNDSSSNHSVVCEVLSVLRLAKEKGASHFRLEAGG